MMDWLVFFRGFCWSSRKSTGSVGSFAAGRVHRFPRLPDHPLIVRILGVVGHSIDRPLHSLTILSLVLVGGVRALGADSPAKTLQPPPPVIPATDVANPSAGGAPAVGDQPAKPGPTSILPDNLPILVDPTRPDLIPRRPAPRKVPVIDPLAGLETEGESAPADELPSFLEAVEPAPQISVAQFALEDPLARTSLSNILSPGELFFDGFGGVIRPLNVVTLPQRPFDQKRGFRMGPLHLRPGISGALLGTRRSDDGKRSDETSAAIGANISGLIGTPETGRYLTLEYGIVRTFESEQAQDSDFDHSLFLAGHLEIGKLKLGLGINFETLSGFNRDAETEVQRDYLTVALTSTVQLTPKTSFDWDLATPSGRFPSDSGAGGTIANSSGFTSTNFINYAYTPKSTIGLGFTAGLLEVKNREDQVFQRVLTRVSSTPTPFLSYSATAGVEFRDTGYKEVTHPILALTAVWTPRERTVVTLSGEQRIQNSVGTANSNFVSSTFVLSVSQQLGDRFRAGIYVGFENAKYESIGIGEAPNRRDRSYLGQFSLSGTLSERVEISGSLSYTRTNSIDSHSYTAQATLQASFLF